MKAKMIKVSAAVTADVLFILQAVGTNLFGNSSAGLSLLLIDSVAAEM